MVVHCICFNTQITFRCICNWYLFQSLMKFVMHIFTNLFAQGRCNLRSIFKQSLTGLNLEFSFSLTGCHTKVKDPGWPYYLLIARGRIVGFISFPRILVLYQMQTASSKFWTQITVFFSNANIHYTMSTSIIATCMEKITSLFISFFV